MKIPDSRSLIEAAGLLLSVLLLAGCAARVPANHYYALQTALPAAASAAAPLPVNVAVARFGVASRALAQERIVYRQAPHQVGFYEYHRWVDSPADLVTQNLTRRLARSGLFRSVTPLQAGSAPDFIVGGRVESLEEVDSADDVLARAAVTVELTDPKTRTVVWSGRGAQDVPVRDRSVDGVVRALNQALTQSLDQVAVGLISCLQRR